MTEVVVDQKPKPQLPYDPADIPEAVRARAAAVDALYQNGSQSSAEGEPKPEQLNLSLEPEPAPQAVDHGTQPPSPSPAESRPAEPDEQSWHHRYLAMQGRYNASQKTLGEMQEQMTQLGNELLHTQRMVQQRGTNGHQAPPHVESEYFLTEQDEQNYGRDLIDFTRRAAAEVVSPHIRQVQEENARLQQRLAQEARHRLDQQVEIAVPNYRDIDRDPRWHRWLLGVDFLSGRVRQELLNEAKSAASAPRVISFFRSFQNEEQATGHRELPTFQQAAPPKNEPVVPLISLATPGRARPATGGDSFVPPDRPTYTRAQIAQLYSQHRRGAYVGREAEWARQEVDIIAAGREGRIRM